MEEDFLRNLGWLGFTARLKRLSDALAGEARDLYRELGLEIEPNWHLLFLLLEKEELSVTEAAGRLGISHPAVIKIVTRMKARDLMVSIADPTDRRKQHLRLTSRGKETLAESKRIWSAVGRSLEEAAGSGVGVLTELGGFEAALRQKGLKARSLTILEKSPDQGALNGD